MDPADREYSLMFCGNAQLRDMLHVLLTAGVKAARETPRRKRFHMTMLDDHPGTFARLLVIFCLLDDFWILKGRDLRKATLATVAYVYSAQLMPAWAWANLQEAIGAVIKELKSKKPVLRNFFVAEEDRAPILAYLHDWKCHTGTEGPYTTANVRQ
jgi:hypothetical protein